MELSLCRVPISALLFAGLPFACPTWGVGVGVGMGMVMVRQDQLGQVAAGV